MFHSLAMADSNQQLLDMLKENGGLTAQQHQQLTDSFELQNIESQSSDNIIDTSRGLEVASMDGESYLKLEAFLALDWVNYQDDENLFGDGTDIRHAKIYFSGIQNGQWIYSLSLDVSSSELEIDTASIRNNSSFPWSWTVGQFKQPFSLEELTSSRFQTFMERSLINELALDRGLGVAVDYQSIDLNWTVGVFGERSEEEVDDEGDEGWSITSRLVYAPVVTDVQLLHLGFSLSKQLSNDEHKIKFHTRPESHLTDLKLLDTGKIKDVNQLNRKGLEIVWVYGPWSLQSELIQLSIDREDEEPLEFSGWYSQISYFLTGESRRYEFSLAEFKRLKPLYNKTAIELALRVSELDLDDADIEGGKGKQTTLGINWYLSDNIKVMLNHSRLDYSENADADGDAQGNDQARLWQARMQMEF